MAKDSIKKVEGFKNIISKLVINEKMSDYFSRRDGLSKRNQRIFFTIIIWIIVVYLVKIFLIVLDFPIQGFKIDC